uniref:Cytochrome b n=1 Tax=Trichosporon inkin TaxID=82517 RepID=A0A7S8WV48_9TREE|nr:apocytochrome b [Trichosporon inkin]QPF23696.1 apocytochrome b [Trichosporon inkin]
MRLLKSNKVLSIVNSYIVDSPQPSNISYIWNFGSLLATCLGIQIVTGVILAMHYTPNVDLAFISVEHIMRDVNYGWMIRYLHANTASFLFIFVYLHIARGMYYGSYKSPRILPWSIGVIILVLIMGTAFLAYVLPYGQMSLWEATVITNMLSAIPWIGQDFVQFVWGGFSVNNATLNRFFSLHYLLPFILAALAILHMMTLHVNGSSNPLGISSNVDRIPMHPYYMFKDLITFFLFFLALAIIVFYLPNVMGHSDNYIPANPMQTPPSIVPEWYLLPYYAILRSIPNKLLGVIPMLASLLILLAMPILDTSRVRGSQFRPLMRFSFWVFVTDFFLLMYLGSQHAEEPYITIGMIATAIYFGWFVILLPVIGIIENTLMHIATDKNPNKN